MPRAPSHATSVTGHAGMSHTPSAGITLPSSLLRTHAPATFPPSASAFGLVRPVFAGCGQPLLAAWPSRRYLCEPFSGCLDLYPGGPQGAWLVSSPEASAFPAFSPGRRPQTPCSDFGTGWHFEAAVIRLRFRPPDLLALQIAPTAGFPGQPGLCRSGPPPAVASGRSEPANRPNRAIDDVGTCTPPGSQHCRLLRK